MKRKIIILAICTLLITLVLPNSIADEKPITTTKDDVEISITAGWRGKDFGLGVTIDMLNHKTEDVTVFFNLTLDYIIPDFLDTTSIFNYTLIPDLPVSYHHGLIPCYPDGIKFVSIIVEAENKIISRKGFSIRNFIIFFK